MSMKRKNFVKNLGLIGIGVITGVAASVQFSAFAQKGGNAAAEAPLPLD